jgi:YidC/Oxa1 family membrane protein insertase
MIALANILQPLIDIASAVLGFFHDLGLGWGASIIALTFATRALLIPLTYKQIKGMRALQALQPQIKEIQEKFKNDRQRMQQEMMRFYQENKVNPLASCVPLLAQIPVFITLFYALREDLRLDICGQTEMPCGELPTDDWPPGLDPGSESFLFIPDLTDKADGGVLIALIALYVVTQLFAGLVMAMSADRSQRALMLVLPLIFIPFIISFPAGLVLYWITTNVWTIGQQYAVKKVIPPPAVPSQDEVRAAKPPPPPPRKKKKKRR